MAKRASPGEGRPYQRSADGRWAVVVRDQDNRRRYLYAGQKADVIAKRDEWTSAIRMGMAPPSGRLTVGKLLDDWLEDRFGKVRPTTWASYEGMVRIHLGAVTRIQLVKLTPADVRRLLRERTAAGCAPRTTSYALTVLRMALNQARRDGLVPRNVAELVDPPRRQRAQLHVWTDVEARRFLAETSGTPLGRLWVVLLGTACRLGEAIGLRRADVDVAGGRITISGGIRVIPKIVRAEGASRLQRVEPKTDESWRTIAVAPFVLRALVDELEASSSRPRSVAGYVFTTPRGTPLDPRNVSRSFEAAIADAGVTRIRIHDLRHSAISYLLSHGYTLEDIKRLVGHSSIAVTSDTYGHLVEGRSREVADGMERAIGGAG
jgi:integrase